MNTNLQRYANLHSKRYKYEFTALYKFTQQTLYIGIYNVVQIYTANAINSNLQRYANLHSKRYKFEFITLYKFTQQTL